MRIRIQFKVSKFVESSFSKNANQNIYFLHLRICTYMYQDAVLTTITYVSIKNECIFSPLTPRHQWLKFFVCHSHQFRILRWRIRFVRAMGH